MKWTLFFILTLMPLSASAQFFTTESPPLNLSVLPEYITPDGAVSLTITPTPSPETMVIWSRNGKTFLQGYGIGHTTTTAGALGTETVVRASVEDGTLRVAQAILRPSLVSLLWSSNSYTPPFYKGRAEPTGDSSILVEAFPEFIVGKRFVPSQELLFTWSVNNSPQPTVSGIGKSRAVFTAPLSGIHSISVTVTTKDSLQSAQAATTLHTSVVTPILYQAHPLYGTLFHRALSSYASFPETDVEFVAVPYFSSARTSSALTYNWFINDTPAHINPDAPDHVRLTSQGKGSATLSLSLSNVAEVLESAEKVWTVFLGQKGSLISL